MISTVTYQLIGSETVTAGETEVYFHPASGLEIIDIIINGVSQDFSELTIDETYGKIAKAGLVAGDWISCTYKTLPRVAVSVTPTPTMVDFSETDFESADFA